MHAPDLLDQADGIAGTQRGIPQVLDRLAVPLDLRRAFLVPVAEGTLDEHDGALGGAFPELEEIKIAVGTGMRADVPRLRPGSA
jgi:hypothetical protein